MKQYHFGLIIRSPGCKSQPRNHDTLRRKVRLVIKTKTKIKSLKSLKTKCWKLFSEYIRRRAADWRGYVSCITCGTSYLWNSGDIHAGHWIHDKLDYDERNVHPQCFKCNYKYNKNVNTRYAIFMAKTYGVLVMEELTKLANTFGNNYSRQEVLVKIEELKQKLAELP